MTFNRINPKKICLIVNSNFPQSLTDAQWYAQQRGLDPNMILSFDFVDFLGPVGFYSGPRLNIPAPINLRNVDPTAPVCTTPGYTQYSFAQACATYFADHGCEGVICSTYTPQQVGPITLAQYASDAYYWTQCALSGTYVYNWAIVKGRGYDYTVPQTADPTVAKWLNIVHYISATGIVPSCYFTSGMVLQNNNTTFNNFCLDVFAAKVQSTWKSDNYPQIPHGRLGISNTYWPDPVKFPTYGGCCPLVNAEIMNPYIPTQSIMYKNVQDAMAAEQVDHRNDLHLFSTDKTYVSAQPEHNAKGYRYAKWVGVNAKTINNTGGDYNTAQWNAGQVPPFFACTIASGGPTQVQYARGAPYQPTVQGAYFIPWVSGSAGFNWPFLQNGGCSLTGQFEEPTASHCGPNPSDVFQMLYRTGGSMMECNFLCNSLVGPSTTANGTGITSITQAAALVPCSGWGTALGDPLYSPYRSTNTAGAYVYSSGNNGVNMGDGIVAGI